MSGQSLRPLIGRVCLLVKTWWVYSINSQGDIVTYNAITFDQSSRVNSDASGGLPVCGASCWPRVTAAS
jgi:hypothetical protein